MNNIVSDIRKKQDEIIMMINSTFDKIIRDVSSLEQNSPREEEQYEIIYPITNVSGFKGTKVIAVILNNDRIKAPTWKTVVKIVLSEVIKDEDKKRRLYALREKILGRNRTRLSAVSDDMRSPLKLDEDLYIETHYDTEALMDLLLKILNDINYDYSQIKIVIKN